MLLVLFFSASSRWRARRLLLRISSYETHGKYKAVYFSDLAFQGLGGAVLLIGGNSQALTGGGIQVRGGASSEAATGYIDITTGGGSRDGDGPDLLFPHAAR